MTTDKRNSITLLCDDLLLTVVNLRSAAEPHGDDGTCISDVEFVMYEIRGLIQEIEEHLKMTNAKEFSDKYYITKVAVLDCGEEVWEKFRHYVYDHVTKEGGIKEGCAEFWHDKVGDNADFIIIDRDGWFMWWDDTYAEHEFTKQDILNILSHHGYIKQEEPTVPKFKAMKFRVKDEEHSAHIQKYLFSLGYSWRNYGALIAHTDKHFIYAGGNGQLAHGEAEDTFYSEPEQEHTLDVQTTVTYVCNPVENPRTTIELNGVSYYVDDLEKALRHIKPVESV